MAAVLTSPVFLMTGNLHADYERVGGLLGFPACSSTQWGRIVKRLEEFVSDLAEWSCSQVRKEIMERGDDNKWMASFDGFYLTRGHYSKLAHSRHVSYPPHSMTTPLGTLRGSPTEPNMVQDITGQELQLVLKLTCWMSFSVRQR